MYDMALYWCCLCAIHQTIHLMLRELPPGMKAHLRLASSSATYELPSVNKFAGVLNASSERLFHLADTNESLSEMPVHPSRNGLIIRLALRPSVSLFTLASSWKLASFNSGGRVGMGVHGGPSLTPMNPRSPTCTKDPPRLDQFALSIAVSKSVSLTIFSYCNLESSLVKNSNYLLNIRFCVCVLVYLPLM